MVMAEVLNGCVGVSHAFCDRFWSGSTLFCKIQPICRVILSLWPGAVRGLEIPKGTYLLSFWSHKAILSFGKESSED